MNNSSNTIPFDWIIFGTQVTTVLFLTAVQITVYRIGTTFLVLLRMAHKYRAFMENRILLLFYTLLLVGNILIGAAELFLAIESNAKGQFNFDYVMNAVNIIVALGILCIDAFFGLIPNMFYSVFKTGLGKGEDHVTKIYFTANGIIIAIFFIVTLVFNFLGPQYVYITNIIVIIEIVYAVLFYLVALRAVFRLDHAKFKRMLLKFFIYYVVYALTQIVRCSILTFSFLDPPNPHHTETLWGVLVMDSIVNAVLTIIIVLFLKDFKLKSKQERSSTYSGSKTLTKEIPTHD
eukprot:TRINITY_DN1821_c0_g1_i1.p1 TRINITY_DN1821_c0_g1~~TRINITY_DN1821_c0_g1_i1.p1  ORF type:complete len:291 (-),score=54.60 TRINITY_DN1821_c0_g1_i1:91-963(-)